MVISNLINYSQFALSGSENAALTLKFFNVQIIKMSHLEGFNNIFYLLPCFGSQFA